MFGTLYVPGKSREKLSFGVEPDRFAAHTITGELVAPFIRAWASLRALGPKRAPRLAAMPARRRKQPSQP